MKKEGIRMGEPVQAHKEHINKYKMAHMIGVAEYMRDNAYKYGIDKDVAYTVGLLHDIGYLNGRTDHERSGAQILRSMGVTEDTIVNAVLLHGTSPLNNARIPYEDIFKENPMLCLTYEADMSIDAEGHRVGLDKRLEDIGRRYGKVGIEYQTARETVDFVKDCLARIEEQQEQLYIEIYQLRRGDDNNLHYKRFSSLEQLKKEHLRLEPSDYELVYKMAVENTALKDKEMLFEDVFMKFQNGNHTPSDYKGRSISVSDIIVICDGNKRDINYVDELGFCPMRHFDPAHASQTLGTKKDAAKKSNNDMER